MKRSTSSPISGHGLSALLVLALSLLPCSVTLAGELVDRPARMGDGHLPVVHFAAALLAGECWTEGCAWGKEITGASLPNRHTSKRKRTVTVGELKRKIRLDKLFLHPSGRRPDGSDAHLPEGLPKPALPGISNNASDQPDWMSIYPELVDNTLRVLLPDPTVNPLLIPIQNIILTGSDGRQFPVRRGGPVARGAYGNELVLYIRNLPPGVYTLWLTVSNREQPMEATFVKTS